MNKALVIEDDHYSAEYLIRLIKRYDDNITVFGPLKSVAEVIEHLAVHNDYDIIFSDIRLCDGNIFDAFKEIHPNAFVVYTTAYDEYALKAIKNNGLDYLMKPFDYDELSAAIAKRNLANPDSRNYASQHQLAEKHSYRNHIAVSKGDELIILDIKNINYFVSESNKVFAVTDEESPYQLSESLQELEQTLNPREFFRINRQYIVNIKAINKICNGSNSKLSVKINNCKNYPIILSKQKSAQFKVWINE